MPAYYIGEHKISNLALFDDYLAEVVPMVERFGGRYLTKAGSHEILEGEWKPNRVVIIEFPDIASIKNWYRTPEYQPLIALRRSTATDVMIILRRIVISQRKARVPVVETTTATRRHRVLGWKETARMIILTRD